MTISTQIARAQYAGNGVTTSFSVPFEFLTGAGVSVIYTAPAGTDVTWVQGTNYTLTGGGAQQPATGSIVATVAPPLGSRVTILRSEPLTQQADYIPDDPFPATAHEKALDRLSMQVQMLSERVGRAPTLRESSSLTGIAVPDPVAGQLIGWNASADNLENKAVSSTIGETFPTNAGRYIRRNAAGTAFEALSAQQSANLNLAADAVIDNTIIAANAAIIDTKLSHLQSGTGAVARTVAAKLGEWLSVKDFDAKGDNSTNDTAAIVAAITAAGALSTPGVVFFPQGIYRVTTLGTLPQGVHLVGSSRMASVIRTTSATATVVAMNGVDNQVCHLGFDATVTRSAGYYVDFATNAYRCSVSHLYLVRPFGGIHISDSTASAQIRDTDIYDTVNTTGNSIVIDGGFAVHLENVLGGVSGGGIVPNSHVLVNHVEDLVLANCQFLTSVTPMLIQPTGGTKHVGEILSVNTQFDGATFQSVRIVPGTGSYVARLNFVNSWFGAVSGGSNFLASNVNGGTLDSINVLNSEFPGAGNGAGFDITGAANTILSNSTISAHTIAASFNNCGKGVVSNNIIGAVDTGAINTVGVNLQGTTDNFVVDTNVLTGNTTPITNTASGTKNRITNNPGYNDDGTPLNIAIGASPFSIPAKPYPRDIYINSGTVTLISVNGVGMWTNSGHTVHAGPNTVVAITHTGAPSVFEVRT